MHIRSIGIDLGKNTFHLVALGEHGKVVIRKKLSRQHLLALNSNLPTSLIGLEACSLAGERRLDDAYRASESRDQQADVASPHVAPGRVAHAPSPVQSGPIANLQSPAAGDSQADLVRDFLREFAKEESQVAAPEERFDIKACAGDEESVSRGDAPASGNRKSPMLLPFRYPGPFTNLCRRE